MDMAKPATEGHNQPKPSPPTTRFRRIAKVRPGKRRFRGRTFATLAEKVVFSRKIREILTCVRMTRRGAIGGQDDMVGGQDDTLGGIGG